MNGEERRNQIVDILKHSSSPVPGTQLAQILDVSRQVIVQDIALIRAKNIDVFSTNRGYVLNDKQEYSRILKVKHGDDEVEAELGAIVDMGGWIRDVFVYHKVYGVIRADMNIHSRRDIRKYLEEIANGKSRSEEHTSELQSPYVIAYAVFCLKKGVGFFGVGVVWVWLLG